MTIVRAQGQFDVAGAPSIGNWTMYRKAYFTVAGSTTPDATVRLLLQRLLVGHHAADQGSANILSTARYRTGAGAFRLQVHTLSGGGSLVKVHDSAETMEVHTLGGNPTVALPPQLAIAVGYRADLGDGVPRQRGRSRIFLGPITTGAPGSYYLDNGTTGGVRMTAAAIDQLALNFSSCVAALASNGWVLGVRVMGATDALATATECYVDDVWDVQRGRRGWQSYQKRRNL